MGDQHQREHEHDGGRGLRGRLRAALVPHRHDAAGSTDSALETSRKGMRALAISFGGLMVTALLQVLVVAVTDSVALLSDTIHNFSDALTAVPIAIAFSIGRRAATSRHTYGFGKAEDLAGVVVVVLIAASAALAGYEAVRRLLDPQELDSVWLVAVAGGVGFLGNEIVARYRIRVGREIGSAALVADGLHARTDGFTSLAVVLGAVGVGLGFPIADPLIGLAITVAIVFVLFGAAREVLRRLMDAVDPELVEQVGAILAATPGVQGVEGVRLRWTGHELRAECEVGVDHDASLVEAHAVAHEAEHRLLHKVPRLTVALVHAEPVGDQGIDHHGVTRHHRQRATR